MARNLLLNGGFYDDLSDWTTQNAAHVDGRAYAFVTSGACELDATGGMRSFCRMWMYQGRGSGGRGWWCGHGVMRM